MNPRWARDGPKLPQDSQKMVPRWPQGDPKMVLSCKRGANFAKSALPTSVRSPRGPKVTPRRPKTSRDGPETTQDGLRMPQDGFKMTPRWTQEAKSCTEEAQQIVLSCRRSVNFAKSAMQRPSSEVVTLKWTTRWPRKPQDGFEMTQDGPKITARWL